MSLSVPGRSRAVLSFSALLAACGLALALALAGVRPASAGPPAGFSLRTVASGFTLPTAFAYRADGTMLVAEKSGRIALTGGGATSETFLDLRADIDSGGDGGLLGLTIGPDGQVYVLYTRESNPAGPDTGGRTEVVVAAFRQSASNPRRGDAASRRVLVTGFEVSPLNHVGGGLRFDAAGRLLIAFGDGAHYRDVDPAALRSQDLDNLAGKLLRIDPATGAGVPDNPHYQPANPSSVRSRVLARGFRNPFRFGVDHQTGAIYVADVGWDAWEEINVVSPDAARPTRDRNYGWPCYEGGPTGPAKQTGYAADPATAAACRAVYTPAEGGTGEGSAAPLAAISHASGAGGSITGGPMYRGTTYPEQYRGAVFLADYAKDRFMLYRPGSGLTDFGTPGAWGNPVDIQVTPQDTVAYASISTGTIREITHISGNRPPVAAATATPASGPAPLAVRFSAAGSGDPDAGDTLRYSWAFGDGGTSTAAAPTRTYTRRGSYTATLTVRDNLGASDTVTIPIDAGNTRPQLTIRPARTTYRIGDTVPFTIVATDAEDGVLAASRVRWQLIVHHLDHLHYDAERTGLTGSVVADQHGDDVHYEIRATATDSLRGTTTTSIELLPETRELTLASVPAGVPLILDGQARVTPHVRPSAIGADHSLSAPGTVRIDGVTWTLQGIDTGSGMSPVSRVTFTTPDAPQTVTARYASDSSSESGVPAPAPGTAPARPGTAPRLSKLDIRRANGRIVITAFVSGAGRAGNLVVDGRRGSAGWRTLTGTRLTQRVRLVVPDRGYAQIRVRLRASKNTGWRTARTVLIRRA